MLQSKDVMKIESFKPTSDIETFFLHLQADSVRNKRHSKDIETDNGKLQHGSAQLLTGFCAQVSRCDVEYSLAASLAFLVQSVGSSCISYNDRSSKFRVGVELQTILD